MERTCSRSPFLKPTRIQDLPEELIETILSLIRVSTSLTDFWASCKTCRQWRRIGLAIHGRLDFAVSTIVESTTRRGDLQSEDLREDIHLASNLTLNIPSLLFMNSLRSLTVHVLHTRFAGPFSPVTDQDFFDTLADVLETTTKLMTFSLKIPDDGWDYSIHDIPAIASSRLALVVRALPPSVIDLEIDTAGVDLQLSGGKSNGHDETHLCVQIGKILPRLRFLRLRLGHVCEDLLPPGFQPSPCILTETVREGAMKEAVKSWKLQRMTIWMPHGQTEITDSLARSLRDIMTLFIDNGPIVTAVYSQYLSARRPMYSSNGTPSHFQFRSWIKSNESNNGELEGGTTNAITGMVYQPRIPRHKSHPCPEHHILFSGLCKVLRNGRVGELTRPEMSEWVLEDQGRWAQDGHRGCRYPIELGDYPNKPYWKASHARLPTEKDASNGYGVWACLFPGCRSRCNSLYSLQGHHMYAHPSKPHTGTYYGIQPCPSVGCDRIGLNGFKDSRELEDHLLGHHLFPCTESQTEEP
jgi:hypothetical protein